MMKKIAFLIVVMAAVILFWQIHLYPIRFGIYEGLCGLTALKVIEGDKAEIARIWAKPQALEADCFSCNHNPFLIYPTVLVIKIFGVDRYYITLRAVSIIYGIFSVWLLYLFVGKTFNRPTGLIAAFILATSSWFIAFSRIAAEFSATIFFSLLCCYIYSLSGRPFNLLGYLILGAIMGLYPFFYLPARVVMPMILFAILLRIFTKRGYFKTYNKSLLLMMIAFFLVLHLEGLSLPKILALKHSSCEWFWVRYGFHPHDCATPWQYLASIFKFAYNRFFVQWGWFWDPVVERDACLDPITRYILLVGLAWALFKIRDHKYRFLLIWFVFGALLTFLTQTWFRRSILVIPAIAALSAVGIYQTLSLLFKWIKMEKLRNVILFVLIGAILIPIARLNLEHYFGLYRDQNLTRSLRTERERREKFLELLPKYTVYTDLFWSESGWPESGRFEAKRFQREAYYKPGPASIAQKDFENSPGPSALLLKNGEIKTKEAQGEEGKSEE